MMDAVEFLKTLLRVWQTPLRLCDLLHSLDRDPPGGGRCYFETVGKGAPHQNTPERVLEDVSRCANISRHRACPGIPLPSG
mgnify:CR=1 FL=1